MILGAKKERVKGQNKKIDFLEKLAGKGNDF